MTSQVVFLPRRKLTPSTFVDGVQIVRTDVLFHGAFKLAGKRTAGLGTPKRFSRPMHRHMSSNIVLVFRFIIALATFEKGWLTYSLRAPFLLFFLGFTFNFRPVIHQMFGQRRFTHGRKLAKCTLNQRVHRLVPSDIIFERRGIIAVIALKFV